MTPLYRKAIQSIESSGGNYGLVGPSTSSGDRAYGAYQVMGNNIPEWTAKHVGRSMTPQEFLADRDAQDKVFDGQFGSYVDKYGNPQDAASAWFTGGPLSTGANKRDVLGTSGSSYVDKFNRYINGNGDTSSPGALSFAPTERKTSMPAALSADSTMGPGILNIGSNELGGNNADIIGRGLSGIGAAIAGISSPAQAQAITAQMAAMQKAPGNKWSVAHVDPKTGQALLTNGSSFVPWKAFQPKPDDDTYVEEAKKAGAKANQEYGDSIATAAASATGNQSTVDELRKVLSNPGVYQGTGGDWVQSARKLYASMGLGDPKAVADGDVAKALSNKLALQLVQNGGDKLLPGSFSDSDRKFVQQMATSLEMSGPANQRMLDIYDRVNKRATEAEAVRAKHLEANGVYMPTIRKEIADLNSRWAEENKALDSTASSAAASPQTRTNSFTTKSGKTINWSVH